MSHETTKPSAAEITSNLAHYTGDLERYRHCFNRKLICTPGIQYLAESAGAYWLIDAIASHVGSSAFQQAVKADPRIEDLHFWRLDVRDDHSALLAARADSGEPPFISQEIPFTDFPLESIDLWVGYDGEHHTLYLPSEH